MKKAHRRSPPPPLYSDLRPFKSSFPILETETPEQEVVETLSEPVATDASFVNQGRLLSILITLFWID
ncbi:unnamed protein product [Urochloa humidicola]